MATLNENIEKVRDAFKNIAAAIEEKGVYIGECDGPETYADKIRQINTCVQPEETADVLCDYNSLTFESERSTKEVIVTYVQYKTINDPSISYVSDVDWLQVDTVSGGSTSVYNVIASRNESTSNRVAKLTFSCEDDSTVATHVVTITQKGKVIETNPVQVTCLSERSVEVPAEGSEMNVSMQYKYATSIDTPSVGNWITLKDSNETKPDQNTTVIDYTFTVAPNGSTDRSRVLVFSARGEENSTDSENVTVNQKKVITPESVITYKLKMEPESLSIYQGYSDSFTLTAEKYIDGQFDKTMTVTSDADWVSSNSRIASVVRGEVTGLAIGSVTITATYEGVSISKAVQITAKPADPICKVTLNPTAVSLGYQAGSKATVQATFENATPYNVVSNENCEITYKQAEDTNRHSYEIKSLKNGGSSDKTYYVQIKYTNTLTNQIESVSIPVTIAHMPSATISVSPTSVNFTSGGGNKTVKVTVTNTDTYYVVDEDLDWLTTSISGNTVTLTAQANESTSSRSGKVIISCVGLDEVEKQAWVNVTQSGQVIVDEPKPMYYGYIPYVRNVSPTGYDKITGEYILQCVNDGTITKVDEATTMGKTSFGVVPKYALLLIAVPSGEFVATKDDAFGNKISFDIAPLSNGEYSINIDGNSYSLYGEYQKSAIENNKYFYIDKK